MAFDLNSIGELLNQGGVSAIAKRLKLTKGDVGKVLAAGVPVLLSGMRYNAGSKAGEASLSRALADHSAADTKDVGAFLKNADLKDGKKILGHVLGKDQKAIVDAISKASGVTPTKATSTLALVAPLLLSLLGSQNNSQGSSGGLGSLLGGLLGLGGSQQSQQQTIQLVEQPQQQSSGGGLLGSLSGLFGGGSGGSLLGGLGSLLGGGSSSQSSAQSSAKPDNDSSSSLISSFFNLFR